MPLNTDMKSTSFSKEIGSILAEECVRIILEDEDHWHASQSNGKPSPHKQVDAAKRMMDVEFLKHEHSRTEGGKHVNQYGHRDVKYGHMVTTKHDPSNPREFSWHRTDGRGDIKASGEGEKSMMAHLHHHPIPNKPGVTKIPTFGKK